MEYTIEVYKHDGRTKTGEKLVKTVDLVNVSPLEAKEQGDALRAKGFRIEIFETYVTRKNYMTGVEFQERYDTPYFCSASSESYFSM